MSGRINRSLAEALWKIYRRPDWTMPLTEAKNLPWNELGFAERMLQEHLG